MNTPYECLQVQYSNFLIFCMVATWYSRVNPSKRKKMRDFSLLKISKKCEDFFYKHSSGRVYTKFQTRNSLSSAQNVLNLKGGRWGGGGQGLFFI